MKQEFEIYKSRKCEFVKTVEIEDFTVKVYTITNRDSFQSEVTLNTSIELLHKWIKKAKNSSIPTHQHAFLIVHEAREGVLILLNWWTGENMIETDIYFSNFKSPDIIVPSIYDSKQLVCVWELEIFFHERKAWIQYILQKANKPDFNSYSNYYYIQK